MKINFSKLLYVLPIFVINQASAYEFPKYIVGYVECRKAVCAKMIDGKCAKIILKDVSGMGFNSLPDTYGVDVFFTGINNNDGQVYYGEYHPSIIENNICHVFKEGSREETKKFSAQLTNFGSLLWNYVDLNPMKNKYDVYNKETNQVIAQPTFFSIKSNDYLYLDVYDVSNHSLIDSIKINATCNSIGTNNHVYTYKQKDGSCGLYNR